MKKFKSNGSNLVQADWSKKDNSKLKKKKGGINDSKSLVRRVY